MIFDIILPKNPDVKAVTFRQSRDYTYDACDLIDLLDECGFRRMRPCLANHGGYENAVELSTDSNDYLAAQERSRDHGRTHQG